MDGLSSTARFVSDNKAREGEQPNRCTGTMQRSNQIESAISKQPSVVNCIGECRMGSVVYGPLQTLVNIILYAHGFMEKPLYTPEIHLL